MILTSARHLLISVDQRRLAPPPAPGTIIWIIENQKIQMTPRLFMSLMDDL